MLSSISSLPRIISVTLKWETIYRFLHNVLFNSMCVYINGIKRKIDVAKLLTSSCTFMYL